MLENRPLIYGNCKIHGHVLFMGPDCRLLRIENLSDFPSTAKEVLASYPGEFSDHRWGRTEDIRNRFEELSRALKKGVEHLTGALEPGEDPVVKMLILQEVKVARGEAARSFWPRMLTDPYVEVQDLAVKHLLSLGREGASIAVEFLGPSILNNAWTTQEWAPHPPESLYLHRNTAWNLVLGLCAGNDPRHAPVIAAFYRRIPNGAGIEIVADYFERAAAKKKKDNVHFVMALLDALDFSGNDDPGIAQRKYHSLDNPHVRPVARRIFRLLRCFQCPVREPDWENRKEAVNAINAARQWWLDRNPGLALQAEGR